MGQLVNLKLLPFDVESSEIEASVFGSQKNGPPGAITLMLAEAVIFVDEAIVIICIEGLDRY